MARTLFVKVGSEEPRGPLNESDVRASLRSGVLPESTLVGTSVDDLKPIKEVLAASDTLRSKGRRKVALIAGVLFAVVGVVSSVAFYIKTRPPPLCPATPLILSRLKQDIAIRLYVTRRHKKIDTEGKKVEALLQRMKEVSKGKLDFKVIDTSNDEVSIKMAKEAGLQQVQLVDADDNNKSGAAYAEPGVHSGYFGLVFLYGAEQDKIPVLADAEGVEFWIDNKIREISAKGDGTKRKIGITVGHHEVSLDEPNLVPNQKVSIKSVITQYFPYYQLVDVDTKKAIPEDIDGLLVTSPNDNYAEQELHAIDDFVMRGKALAIVASAALPAWGDATMKVKLDLHGLDQLTAGYGLELGRDLVFDEEKAFKVRVDTQAGPKDMTWGFLPKVPEERLDKSSALFFRMSEVVFPFPCSITKHEDKQPGARFHVLARSSASAIRDSRAELDLRPASPPKGQGPAGEVILAASVDGTLRSAFGGGAGSGGTSSAKPARVAVISSSLFFANPFARAGAPNPAASEAMGMMMPGGGGGDEFLTAIANPYVQQIGTTAILTVKNMLDWLTFDDDMATCLDIMKPSEPTKKK